MADEIDRLEIAVEAEANRANRALSGMEKRLNRIADSLEKVTALTAGINGFDKFDTSGLERFKKELDSVFKGSSKRSIQIDDSNLKYASKTMKELQEQFKDSKLEVDISVMGEKELKNFISQAERRYKRLKQTLSDTVELNGSDSISGKAWYKANMQAMQYKNTLDEAKKAMKEFNSEMGRSALSAPITRGDFSGGKAYTQINQDASENGSFKQYDSSVIEDYIDNFAGATAEANTFEAQIKRLKVELSDLESQGYSQYDPEYDKVAQELAEVTEAQKRYNKSMKESAIHTLDTSGIKDVSNELDKATGKAGLFKRAINGIKSSSKKINSLKKSFDSVGKAIKNARKIADGAIHPFKTLRNLISGENGSRRGMSWGRMIGSSLLFNFVFKGISAIQKAIKEGSDNLVQYSSEYNYSISSMVSSLLYLKNAWAAAFSPITNAVAPYISQFIDMIASAVNVVGQFMAALTGKGFAVQAKKAWKDYAAGLDTTKDSAGDAEKALKDLQNYMLGIDELNVIQPGSNSGSGSGSGSATPSPDDMFETVEVSNSMNKLADMFKEAIQNSDFTGIGRMISDKLSDELEGIKWKSVYKKADNFGRGLATFLNGLITPRLFYDLGKTVASSINTAFHAANAFAINFDWDNLGESVASGIKGFFENWDAGLTAETFSNFASGLLRALKSAIEKLGEDNAFEDIGQKIVDFVCGIKWGELSWDLIEFFKALFDAMVDFPMDLARGVLEELINEIFGIKVNIPGVPKTFKDIVKNMTLNNVPGFKQIKIVGDIISVPKGTKEVINIIKPLFDKNEWLDAIKGSKEAIEENFNSAFNAMKLIWDKNKTGTFFDGVLDSIQLVLDKVSPRFGGAFRSARRSAEEAFNGIEKTFKDIANKIITPIGKMVNGIISGTNWVLDKLGSGKKIEKWNVPKFASGSNGIQKDTFGMVNDQKGATYRELVVPPNGKPFIPKGRNVMLPLQRGTKIMPADETKALMSSMPRFAGGIGDFFGKAWARAKEFTGDILDYVSNPEKIMQIAVDKFVDASGWSGVVGNIAGGIVDTVFGSAVNYVKNLFGSSVMEKAIKWAVGIANDNSHGYDQAHRTGPDYDCSSLITTALKKAGLNIGIGTTSTMYGQLTSAGFKNVAGSVNMGNASGMRRGDILLAPGQHTALYLGNGQMVHARINEFGRITGGKPGDQTGNEIAVTGYSNHPWTYVLRYINGYMNGVGNIRMSDLIPALSDGGVLRRGQMFIARERGPELVGSHNGKSTVMNNDQIVKSVSTGVEAAVERQNATTNALLREVVEYQKMLLKKDTSVNIDGKKADKQISKARRNSGYSFSPA